MLGLLKSRSGGALAIALASAGALAGSAFTPEPAFAQAKNAKSPFSPGFQTAAAPLQAKLDAASAVQARAAGGDAAAKAQLDAALVGAPAMLAQAEAAARTPQDKLLAGQFAMNVGAMTNDVRLVERGARAMLATGQLNPTQTTQIQSVLSRLSPAQDPVLVAVEAHMKANNSRAALTELRNAVSNRPAGQPAPSGWFTRATQIAVNGNIPEEAIYWSARQAELYPSNFNWLTATQVARRYGRLEPQETLDLFRLMARSGAFNNDPKFVGSDYLAYAELANTRGAYNEAVKIIDQGIAAGALKAGGRAGQIRSFANGKIAADRASLPSLERDARAAATGVSALATADLLLGFGEAGRAEDLYRLALQKGGIDKDRAQVRLGIAQADLGKFAEARDSFSKVTSNSRLPLSRLWLTYVGQKSPGAIPQRAS